jgi:hypothetical protein
MTAGSPASAYHHRGLDLIASLLLSSQLVISMIVGSYGRYVRTPK